MTTTTAILAIIAIVLGIISIGVGRSFSRR